MKLQRTYYNNPFVKTVLNADSLGSGVLCDEKVVFCWNKGDAAAAETTAALRNYARTGNKTTIDDEVSTATTAKSGMKEEEERPVSLALISDDSLNELVTGSSSIVVADEDDDDAITDTPESVSPPPSDDDDDNNNEEKIEGCVVTVEVPFTDVDCYGQRHPIESEELIRSKLLEFDRHVARIPAAGKRQLLRARRQCPELLTDRFKLMFLRSEVFAADLAAQRYVRYWEKREEVFGGSCRGGAFRPLSLDSVLEGTAITTTATNKKLLSLLFGSIFVLPRDRDRNLLYYDPSNWDPTAFSREVALRAFWYIIHAFLEQDEEVQRRGVICVMNGASVTHRNRDPALTRAIVTSAKGYLPVRITAFHGCHLPVWTRVVARCIKVLLAERLRRRILVWSGSREHVLRSLARLGVDRTCLPIAMGGDVVLDILQWLEERRSFVF
jgi:hypothetical protein